MKKIQLITDGSCLGNPGPGGWACILRFGEHSKEMFGSSRETTNNRMELMAAICALEALKRPCDVTLTTDSQYVKKGITEWLDSWKRRGWKTADKKPVKNADLWRRLDELAQGHDIEWVWVKGHAGHDGNEHADALANRGVESVRMNGGG